MLVSKIIGGISFTSSVVLLRNNKKLTKKQKKILAIALVASLGVGITMNKHVIISGSKFIFYKLKNLFINQNNTPASIPNVPKNRFKIILIFGVSIILVGLTILTISDNSNSLTPRQANILNLMKEINSNMDTQFAEAEKVKLEIQLYLAQLAERQANMPEVNPYSLSGF